MLFEVQVLVFQFSQGCQKFLYSLLLKDTCMLYYNIGEYKHFVCKWQNIRCFLIQIVSQGRMGLFVLDGVPFVKEVRSVLGMGNIILRRFYVDEILSSLPVFSSVPRSVLDLRKTFGLIFQRRPTGVSGKMYGKRRKIVIRWLKEGSRRLWRSSG